jgi:GT2 family glycosyltransferase
MPANPQLSVVIVSYNTREVLRNCLESLFKAGQRLDMEVFVVDNASRDGSAAMVAQDFPGVHLIASEVNLGFAAGNNVAFRKVRGDYVLLFNPDAVLDEAALQRALDHMDADPRAGMGGSKLLGRDGNMEPSARLFPSLLNEILAISGLAARFPKSRFFGRFDRTWDDSERAVLVDWVPGAFTLIRRTALEQVGEFDERFFLYYEEVDLCKRFKAAGWNIWYWPDVVVRHLGGESSKTVEHVEFSSSGSQLTLWRMRSALLYYRKHHGALGAWLMARLESGWHALRSLKAGLGSNVAKGEESRRISAMMQRAWRETLGGQVSPPRPW